MSKLITNRISLSSIVALSFLGVAGNECLAQGSDCINNGTYNVCVAWSIGDDPEEGTDYSVMFHGTDAPDLDLLKGNDGWIVYCEEYSNPGTPADIGVFKTTGGNANYKIQIRNGGAAGFKNVGSASLVPANGKSSSIQAASSGISIISGDLDGLTLTVGSPASGGVMENLLVSGDLTDPLTVTIVKGAFNRIRDLIGDADVTIGKIDGGVFIIGGSLVCSGGCPDITVTDKILNGSLVVGLDVPNGSIIKIQELVETGGGTTKVDVSDCGVFAGTLDLPNGLANANTLINMGGTFSGVIDFHGGAVVGDYFGYIGTSTAEIKNGGAVSGVVYLSQNVPGQNYQYPGTATFASVTSTGEIGTHTTSESDPAHFSGILTVNGSVSGLIEIAGSLLSGAEINITNDLSGDVDIKQDLAGSVTVGGALANGSLTGGGRILVGGVSSGAIKVGKQTESLTLIHVAGGLDPGATIEINTTEGFFDAVGDIHIGGTTPVALPFDGCIRIYDKILGTANGHLKGAIDIVMCHPNGHQLVICIDGSDNGNVTLDQTGCDPANATWDCFDPPGCP